MGFQTTTAINYYPHHIISIRKQVNKNKTFEHQEVKGLARGANWSYYPLLVKNEDDMQEDYKSPMHDTNVTQPYLLAIVPGPQVITPITSHSGMTNKRSFYDAMEIEHEDNSATSKKQKVEGLAKSANQSYYPLLMQNEKDMQ